MRKSRSYGYIKTRGNVLIYLFSLLVASLILLLILWPTVAHNQTDDWPKGVKKTEKHTFATVTAYSELDSCHYPGCKTASGVKAHIGGAACPRKIKLGTKVEINGKTYICNDRTAKRYDGRYDIFMGYGQEAYTKALKFGKQTLEVRI